jgi:MFS family permease
VGLVGFFGMAPFFLFGTFGGLLADSVDRKKLVAFTQFMSLTAALIMVLLFAFDLIAYWHSYVAIMIPGLAWALDMSSRRNLIMDIMGMERVSNGVALDSIGEDSGKIIGPALAGLLIAVVGVTGSYIVLTLIIFIGCLSVIRIKIRTSEKRSHNPNADSIVKQKNYMVFLEVSSVYVGQYSGGPALNVFDGIARVVKDLKQGFGYVSKNNVMISVIVITILMNLFLFPYVQMVSVVSKRVLEVGPFFMGLLLASDGLGSLLGSTFIASRRKIKYQGRVYLYCSILSLFGLAAFSLSSIYALSLLFLVMVGMGVGGFKIMQSALVMIVSDPKFRGRAMGIITLSIGVMPIGNILVGAISQAIGASLTLFAYGFIGFSLVIIAGILMPAVRAEIIPFNGDPKI